MPYIVLTEEITWEPINDNPNEQLRMTIGDTYVLQATIALDNHSHVLRESNFVYFTLRTGIPTWRESPYPTEVGVLLTWYRNHGNQHGYRIFRATSSTAEGVSISEHPILANEDAPYLITLDLNACPGGEYYYYIREVLEPEYFDEETDTLIPEEWGPPSERERVEIPPGYGEGACNDNIPRGFMMMWIENPNMNVNDVWQEIDPGRGTYPVLRQGRTMLPVRAVVEAITDNDPNSARWYSAESRADLTAHGNTVSMWIGNFHALVNGYTVEMDVAPAIENDRTVLPLRFVAEFLGTQIAWVASDNLIIIVYNLPNQELSLQDTQREGSYE